MTVRAYRAAMVAGAAFALLLFFGSGLVDSSTPSTKKSDSADSVAQKWVTWLNDSGHRTSVIIGAFMLVLAAIAFVWFASAIASRFARLGSPTLGFAVLAAVGVAASTAGPLAVVGGHTFGNEPLMNDGHVIWLLVSTAFPMLLLVFGLPCAAFLASLLISARGVLPTWLVVFGWIAFVASVASILFIPLILTLLFFLVLGIYGAVRPATGLATADATTSQP
jgi:hypothetical protein